MKILKKQLGSFKFVFVMSTALIAFLCMYSSAHAAYQQTFIISAYYSPIPGQDRYVTGSLASDIRLNGSGVNSADGTPVYPGMIAAPKTYSFGTKMSIPGIGLVAVHDRGGAIVNAGVRGHSFDRLDVWMGYGDAGLSRALNWGKRTVNVTVYGIDPALKENVYLQGYNEAEKFVRTIVDEQKIFKTDLGYGTSSDKVGELQDYLTQLGYYMGEEDNYYGDEVYKAVLAFQIDQDIVDNAEEFGAGYLGPQTRAAIEVALTNRKEEIMPEYNLGKNDNGDEVKKLQQSLKELGYDVEATGEYDQKTIEAVFLFQKENKIVKTDADLGAGFFGPKTYTALSKKLDGLNLVYADSGKEKRSAIADLYNPDSINPEYDAFEAELSLGDKGDDVLKLQRLLVKANLFNIEPTGFYGDLTQHAVFKLQQKHGLLTSRDDLGAGVVGPKTRLVLNGILQNKAKTDVLKSMKRDEV